MPKRRRATSEKFKCEDCGLWIISENIHNHSVKHLQEKLSEVIHRETDRLHRFDAITGICIYCGHSKLYVESYHPFCQSQAKKKKKKTKRKVAKKTTKKKNLNPIVDTPFDYLEFNREV